TPQELQQARRASGNLGGRPRKPTQAEARAAALEELVPVAIKSLRAHLGDGDPAAWRAALRGFEHAFGRPTEFPDEPVDLDPFALFRLTMRGGTPPPRTRREARDSQGHTAVPGIRGRYDRLARLPTRP